MRGHRPTDHASAPGVDDDGQTQETSPRRDVGDVGDPELVSRLCREVPVYEVLDAGQLQEIPGDHQADFPVTTLCQVLGVSPSGYYAWRHRPPSKREMDDTILTERIRQIHTWSRQTYGRPRIHAELADEGTQVSPKRVARLMRLADLRGVCRRRKVRTTRRSDEGAVVQDLVDRDFTARAADELWIADITYIPTWAGFLYLAVVIDAWSRRVVGWAMASHLRTELVLDALNMSLA